MVVHDGGDDDSECDGGSCDGDGDDSNSRQNKIIKRSITTT